jgi:type I restriction enzyme S subunit
MFGVFMHRQWQSKRLGDACEIVTRGISPKYIESEGLCVLNQKCVRNHEINYALSRIHDNKSKLIPFEKLIQVGDVLINSTGTGTLGRIAQVREYFTKATVDSHITILRPPKGIFYNDFFGYALIAIEDEIAKKGEGCGGQTELARSTLNNEFIIKYPESITEQKRVVAILDKVFSAIAKAKENAEKNLANARELFESFLQNVFANPGDGWEVKKLGELCIVERGSSPRPIKRYITNGNDGVNWIKIGDTKKVDKYIYNTAQKITRDGALSSRFVDVGDFILSNSMSFGKPYIMKTQGYIHDGWFVLRLPKHIDSKYFWYLLASPYTMNQFITLASGAVVKNISGDLVKKVILPVPSLNQQLQIVAKLDALSIETKKLKSIYKNKIDDLEELKKSILQRAFQGAL